MKASPARQTAAWLSTACTLEIKGESSARRLESGRGSGAVERAKCPLLLSLQHVWSVGFLLGGGNNERVRRRVFDISQELSSTSRIDSLRCGSDKLIDDMNDGS